MSQKRLDEMTTEELDAWYKRWQHRQAFKTLLVVLLICGMCWGAWQGLKMWTVHEDVVMRARQRRELDAARKAGPNGKKATGSSICSKDGLNCADQPALTVNSASEAATCHAATQ